VAKKLKSLFSEKKQKHLMNVFFLKSNDGNLKATTSENSGAHGPTL